MNDVFVVTSHKRSSSGMQTYKVVSRMCGDTVADNIPSEHLATAIAACVEAYRTSTKTKRGKTKQ